MGQMAVPLITDALGWSALWCFMLCSTVISCLLMIPKELGQEAPAPAAKGGCATIDAAEQKAEHGAPPSPLTTTIFLDRRREQGRP